MRKGAVLAAGVGLAVGLGGIWWWGQDDGSRLEIAVMAQVRRQLGGDPIQVNLADATWFKWDRVYGITPYEGAAAVNRRLGFDGAADLGGAGGDNDGVFVLLFVGGGKVMRRIEVGRPLCDRLSRPEGYAAGEARFWANDESTSDRPVWVLREPARGAPGIAR